MPDLARALTVYSAAAEYVERAGLHSEVQWQRDVSARSFTESQLLAETAWVVLCSGFRESTVRKVFGYLSLCFCDWDSAAAIVASYPHCKVTALRGFRNERKVDAIVAAARHIHSLGFMTVKNAILADPISELQNFRFIGPTTAWHLAKNLGLDVVKPDRHLVRAASNLGYSTAFDLCQAIATARCEQPKVVDLILWRYLADASADQRRRIFAAV
ncbi:hypothetical protein [Dongia deserti]|uniref:hypothetical protein n=1 Tax=Dongia deserti TaxID=2268030 RepID=UPI0013C434FD|nr:hypothetical protein [Dongia deserti]